MASMSKLAVDETSGRRGAFISVFFDAEQRRLLFVTPGRNAATFWAFAEDLSARGAASETITDVSMDMSKAFQAGARSQCPQAQISLDPFHVVQLPGTALGSGPTRRDQAHSETQRQSLGLAQVVKEVERKADPAHA